MIEAEEKQKDARGRITKGHKETFWGDGYVHLIEVMISQVYTDVKTYQIVHFKYEYMQFIVCQLYVSKAINHRNSGCLFGKRL